MTAPNHNPSPHLSPASPLVKFHKLLITAGIVFLLRYAPLEFRHYAQSGAVPILVRSVVAVAAALGLGVYLRRFMRSLGHESRPATVVLQRFIIFRSFTFEVARFFP